MKRSLFVSPPRTKDAHLFLLVDQLTLAHLALRELEGQLDLSVSLGHLEVERDKKRYEVARQQETPDEDQLALRRRLEFDEQREG